MANIMGDALANCAKYNPNGEFLVYGDRRVTWSQLNERVNRLATAFAAQGIKKGDNVVLMFHNCPEFFETNYAIQKLGAVAVPMNYRFVASEIVYQAQHSEAVAFIFEELWLDSVLEALPEMTNIKTYVFKGAEQEGMLNYETLISTHPSIEPKVEVSEEETCVICYTGGTTGTPKGVMLTYKNHISLLHTMLEGMIPRLPDISIPEGVRKRIGLPNFVFSALESRAVKWILSRTSLQGGILKVAKKMIGSPIALRLGKNHQIKQMMPSFPMFHDAAYQNAILAPISGNMTLVMPVNVHFDPEEVCALVEREKPALLGNVPTGWKKLLKFKDIGNYDLSSVLIAATGGGVCSTALKRKIFSNFPGVIIADGFGQTEMAPTTSFKIDMSPESLKDRSVGKPLVETRIVDDDGKDVPAGSIGEIIYRSPTIMKGYYKEEGKTSEVIKDGWFYSGDLGSIDEDGDIRVAERKNECISTGGEKIFPGEIEDILAEHEKIQDICVIGVPDETWGSSVRAVIRLHEGDTATEQEVIDWCRGKMAGYKKPRTVVFVEEFPISAVGKVQRNKVRELYGAPSEEVLISEASAPDEVVEEVSSEVSE
ncbi:MAG: acyl--CoA ligase [Pseudomonadales bacterium]|nr:acyl--CoA ligase [Pseudomonadales bacterium]